MGAMDMRFSNSADRSRIDVQLPADTPVPRVGDTVMLPTGPSGETARWAVKSVVWDYSRDAAAVDIIVIAAIPARTPSFAAYTD
jgi:hypothetical protein